MAQRGSPETIKRKELVGKLNPLCLKAFSAAAQTAKTRGNPYVELVHFVAELARSARSDFEILLQSADVDEARLEGDIARAIDALPHGAGSVEEFSDHIFRAIQDAWTFGSLEFGDDTVRSAYLLLGALKTPVLEGLLFKISLEFDKIDPDAMAGQLSDLLAASIEATAAPAKDDKPKARPGGQSALDQYATNLTERAKAGEIDPVVGRDMEIRQIIDILMRRRQNNPILTGEAGVGKTAVVEGFALRLARGDVPPQLRAVELHMLDVGLMQAGASVKGEFEKRLKTVIDEVQSSDKPIILFIDEAHTLIGAGGAAGTGDAANLLKPALARGELRTVAATTWAEYKEHIEKDPALTRRFQVVKVEEPSEEAAIRMCRGVAAVLEKHHKVEILDEAIEAAVTLSHRYIPARQLPDKAISLLDTSCARVAVSQHATPAEVEDIERRKQALEIEAGIIEREEAIGIDTGERRAEVDAALADTETELAAATERWEAEKALVDAILDLRGQLRRSGVELDETGTSGDLPPDEPPGEGAEEEVDEAPPAALSPEERDRTLTDLRAKMAELTEAQGERPLILPSVDRNAVASVVQDWTGIPMGRMLASQTERALALAGILSSRVVGQDHAMEMIANRIQTSYAGLGAPEKPIGVFMLCGPSGVGKTETALALAEALYGGEQNLISINMSEFQEAHTVSTLKGAPPGYVGYGKGGILTEAVRRRPYSVILLDEVEKAHPDVHEIFFQVFDKGMMDDSEGRRIDFKNTLILLTSNVGTDEIMAMTEVGKTKADLDDLTASLRAPLLKTFPAALLGRVVTIPYYPLSDEMIEAIAGHKLKAIARRLIEGHDAELVIGGGLMDLIRARCTEIESGGRMIDAILTNTLLPDLSRQVLNRKLEGKALTRVTVTGGADGFGYEFD
ncbi:type VI secretion system ATPase TssH [Defluviimonas aestuarii]|uniref:type VI secretion system ATPase TssH n=1 Tax=Albidovulum aestuarii TaxID=1130726 RepID=UPI00249CEF50|nr:type VI secretion system ATPase TssH [Defluviimonas aestuarii]MDI3337726.1 type VI secretion system ATPase TssH [Defluviimonas aestuarii]